MKIKGFLKDVTGASRVTKRRKKLFDEASTTYTYSDPIREVEEEVHPSPLLMKVSAVENVSPTTKKFTFVPSEKETRKLPPFQAGQYVSLKLDIGTTKTTRPYSICSAPFEARQGKDSFFAIAVRNGKTDGFAANYLYSNLKVGDELWAELPCGQFYHEPLRDATHVVALAGGSGITPFVSMAKEVAHGTLPIDLTILYGSVSTKDIILEKELSEIHNDHVRFVNVISGEEDYQGEKGFLSAELIKKYSFGNPSEGKTTYFVCGPLPMYRFVKGELEKLHVPAKRIRMEVFGAPRDITKEQDYPKEGVPSKVRIHVLRGIQEDVIDASPLESVAVALERAGIPNHTRCRSGACGYCRSELLDGKVYIPKDSDGRRLADKENGYIHACQTYPLSDLTICIPII